MSVGDVAVLRKLLPVVLVSVGACHTAVLSPAGPVGEGDRIVLLDSLAIMLAIVVPTIVAILAFAYWFRASNTRAPVSARVRLLRKTRAHRLVDPGARHLLPGRHRLDQLPLA